MENFAAKMDELVAALNIIEAEKHAASKFSGPPDLVIWKNKGTKFAYIDIGTSGAWLVEKTNGEIFNIKGYGVPDYNKKKKADIGNIATVDPRLMHTKRYNYLR